MVHVPWIHDTVQLVFPAHAKVIFPARSTAQDPGVNPLSQPPEAVPNSANVTAFIAPDAAGHVTVAGWSSLPCAMHVDGLLSGSYEIQAYMTPS